MCVHMREEGCLTLRTGNSDSLRRRKGRREGRRKKSQKEKTKETSGWGTEE